MSLTNILWYSNWNLSNTYIFEGYVKSTFEADIITKGVIEFSAKDKVSRLYPGDMVICSPNMYHCTKVVSQDGAELTSIHFDFSDRFINKDRAGYFRLDHNSALLSKILYDEIREHNGVVTDVANSIFEALLRRCFRESEEQKSIFKNSSSTIYRDAITYMNEKMATMLSVPEIAHNCGICETSLKNAFKHHTGKSVKKYYSELKIQKATELLEKGINAKQVAAMLGFSTLSYFSQFFKRETGCSIRDFLRKETPA